ncbi:hypothetical protein M2145_002873 [Lachnospiraceae bacterium PF1-21]|nr:hypothetical protein [Ohessyouella blattaphilus]
MNTVVMQALEIMGKGMAGIFVTTIIIMIFVFLMGKIGKDKDEEK